MSSDKQLSQEINQLLPHIIIKKKENRLKNPAHSNIKRNMLILIILKLMRTLNNGIAIVKEDHKS